MASDGLFTSYLTCTVISGLYNINLSYFNRQCSNDTEVMKDLMLNNNIISAFDIFTFECLRNFLE